MVLGSEWVVLAAPLGHTAGLPSLTSGNESIDEAAKMKRVEGTTRLGLSAHNANMCDDLSLNSNFMGYTTEFKGELKFKKELTGAQMKHLGKYLGKDRRKLGWEGMAAHEKYGSWCHIDLEFNDDYTGLRWDGSEKTYEMCRIIEFLTDRMREKWPEFELTGELFAQGEDSDDMWRLRMEDGVAKQYPLTLDEILSLPYKGQAA